MTLKLGNAIALVISFSIISCMGQSLSWGERMAETVMKTYPDSIVVKKVGEKVATRPTSWDYEQGEC